MKFWRCCADCIDLSADPTVFSGVLSYLRTHKAHFLLKEDDVYLQLLLIEADFYQYPDLTSAIFEELEKRKLEEERKYSSAVAAANSTAFKVVPEAEVSLWFDRGWSFVSQYYGNESYGCPSGSSYRVATFHNRGSPRCSACNEPMHYERFLKHVVLFKPCLFVISKKSVARSRASSASATLPPIPTSVGGALSDDMLANIIAETTLALEGGTEGLLFDQSFG